MQYPDFFYSHQLPVISHQFKDMRIIIQRVTRSQVVVEGEVIGKIGRGLNLLVAIAPTDTITELDWMINKCLNLKLFPDGAGKPWGRSVQDIEGELLVVSQFTLYGDCRKGRRPSFSGSAKPDAARQLYEEFVTRLKVKYPAVQTGKFGAMMQVDIENDGPVTLILEREATT